MGKSGKGPPPFKTPLHVDSQEFQTEGIHMGSAGTRFRVAVRIPAGLTVCPDVRCPSLVFPGCFHQDVNRKQTISSLRRPAAAEISMFLGCLISLLSMVPFAVCEARVFRYQNLTSQSEAPSKC